MHEHRAASVVGTEVGHAAEQQPLCHSLPVAADDDEVRPLALSREHNGVPAAQEPGWGRKAHSQPHGERSPGQPESDIRLLHTGQGCGLPGGGSGLGAASLTLGPLGL